MPISEQVQKDMVEAMRSRDELRLSTLRMVKSALKLKGVDERHGHSDEELHGQTSGHRRPRRRQNGQRDREETVGRLSPLWILLSSA